MLLVLGTPSTVATVSGEVFYYISQRTERAAAFLPDKTVNQRVIAVYFDKDRRVRRSPITASRMARSSTSSAHHADRRQRQFYLGYLFNDPEVRPRSSSGLGIARKQKAPPDRRGFFFSIAT